MCKYEHNCRLILVGGTLISVNPAITLHMENHSPHHVFAVPGQVLSYQIGQSYPGTAKLHNVLSVHIQVIAGYHTN